MRTATLDRVLAVLVVAMAGTGLLALKSGGLDAAWVFTIHGLIGGALLLATLLKARRSLPPAIRAGHTSAVVISLVVTVAIAGALIGGYLWVASGRLLAIGPWTVLSWHAWFGLALVPLVVIHLLPRRWRVLRPPARGGVSRRTLLVTGGLAVAGVAAFGATAILERLLGGTRRFTGSRLLAPGSIPPATTFYGEAAPAIDVDAWRLRGSTGTRYRSTNFARSARSTDGRPRLHVGLGGRDDLARRPAALRDRHPGQLEASGSGPSPAGRRSSITTRRARPCWRRASAVHHCPS